MFYRFYMLFIPVWHWLNQKFTWDGESLGKYVCLFGSAFYCTPEGEVLKMGYDDPQNTGCRWWVMMTPRRQGADDGLWWPSEYRMSMTAYDDPQKVRCWWQVMMTLRTQGVDDGLRWPPEAEVPMMGYDDPCQMTTHLCFPQQHFGESFS